MGNTSSNTTKSSNVKDEVNGHVDTPIPTVHIPANSSNDAATSIESETPIVSSVIDQSREVAADPQVRSIYGLYGRSKVSSKVQRRFESDDD